jgi:hypothetical protein
MNEQVIRDPDGLERIGEKGREGSLFNHYLQYCEASGAKAFSLKISARSYWKFVTMSWAGKKSRKSSFVLDYSSKGCGCAQTLTGISPGLRTYLRFVQT